MKTSHIHLRDTLLEVLLKLLRYFNSKMLPFNASNWFQAHCLYLDSYSMESWKPNYQMKLLNIFVVCMLRWDDNAGKQSSMLILGMRRHTLMQPYLLLSLMCHMWSIFSALQKIKYSTFSNMGFHVMKKATKHVDRIKYVCHSAETLS